MSGLFSSLQSQSIRGKVIAGFVVLVMTIGLLEFFAFLQVRQLSRGSLKENFKNLQREVNIMTRASNEFLLKDRTREEFMQTGESYFLARYHKSFETFKHTLDDTEVALAQSGFQHNKELEALHMAVVAFDTTFQDFTEALRKRGGEKYGIIGDFDKALGKITGFDFGQDNEVLLNLKLFVKEYQLTGDEEIVKNAKYMTYRFSRVLENYITDEQVDEVLVALASYEESFNRLTEIDNVLGIYSGEGLQKILYDQMNVIDNHVGLKETQTKIAEAYDQLVKRILISLLIIFLTSVALAFIIIVNLYQGVVRPIDGLKDVIRQMGEGSIPDTIKSYKTKEVAEMATHVSKLASGMKDTAAFAYNIGKGELQASFTPLSDRDVLGHALITMRDNLEKVAKEEEKRKWVNEGYAQFIDLLRSQADSLEILCDKILAALIKYVNANQGALFVISEEEGNLHLEMKACYAWKRKKHIEKNIKPGEGLLGQAWLEGERILLTEVPDEYILLTSGLGKANPNAIMIVPLKNNDKVVGIMELASFKVLESYEVDFIEKIAESMAATISSMKTNEVTKKLLVEAEQYSQMQKDQEEEMRQNMEELSATQEEMQRKEKEYLLKIEALEAQESPKGYIDS